MDMLRHLKLNITTRIYFSIDDEKLLQKWKSAWNKIDGSKNIKLNVILFYDDRYEKTKRRTYGDKVYTNSRDINVPENDIECESFTVLLILYLYTKVDITCKYI